MISPPTYTGKAAVLPEDITTHHYFSTTKVAEWSLEGFLTSTGLTELAFMSKLKDIARIKRLPNGIRLFIKNLQDYYSGSFHQEVIEIAKNNARKNINRALLSGKEHLLLQSHVNDTLERDKYASSLGKRSMSSLGEEESVIPISPQAECSAASTSTAALVFNTASKRNSKHFEEFEEEGFEEEGFEEEGFEREELVETAKTLNIIKGLEQHECSTILKKYVSILAKDDLNKFLATLIIDRGSLLEKYQDQERLPASAELEDKVLQILIILGERVMEASKIMRQHQTAEFSGVSESARKVDLLFMYDGVEISNIRFKKPGITERDIAIQHKKSIRLARCIQEAHAALGVEKSSVMMADVAGSVGAIYQVRPMGEIAIIGETTSAIMHLPHTHGSLKAFMEDNSLALLWNYSRLETQGRSISKAKDRHELALQIAKFKRGIAGIQSGTPQPNLKKQLLNKATLTPSRKKARIQISSEMLQDSTDQTPSPSPQIESSNIFD
ncbi:hypothetical protein EDD11_002414 [Mortierella claussenii]|nr:hypothetical protein EDD11_002414 [Mortierella claussenii]